MSCEIVVFFRLLRQQPLANLDSQKVVLSVRLTRSPGLNCPISCPIPIPAKLSWSLLQQPPALYKELPTGVSAGPEKTPFPPPGKYQPMSFGGKIGIVGREERGKCKRKRRED
jgi:hypothetical protein